MDHDTHNPEELSHIIKRYLSSLKQDQSIPFQDYVETIKYTYTLICTEMDDAVNALNTYPLTEDREEQNPDLHRYDRREDIT